MVDAFSEGFFGDNPDKDSVDKVLGPYKDNVKQHTIEHYELYANSHNKAALTAHQLLYYHVYGDYRLTLNSENKPRFIYRTRKETERRPTLLGRNGICGTPELRKGFFLNSYLENETDHIVSGVYDKVSAEGGLRHDIERVPWLNMEMTKQGTGTLFNIPSIGTQIVKLHSYGNASDGIKKALIDELDELVEYYNNNDRNHPDVFFDQNDDELMELLNHTLPLDSDERITEDDLNDSIPGLLAVFITSLLSNQEYLNIPNRQTKLPSESKLRDDLRDIYREEYQFDMYAANTAMVNALFANTGKSFAEGTRVTLSKSVSNNIVDQIADQFGVAGNEDESRQEVKNSSYVIIGYESEGNDRDNGYTLRTVDLVSGGTAATTVFSPTWLDDNDIDERYMFKAKDLIEESMTLDLEGTGDVGKHGKGKKTLEPTLILFQRIMMDTFCAIQILCELSSEYSDTKPTGELKIRYLSVGVNTYSSTATNQKKEKKINNLEVYHTFPNMTTFNRTGIGNTEPEKKDKPGNVGYLDKLTKWRTYYTLSILAQIRKKTIDRQHMDEFYSNNLLIKEVEWLSVALGDGAKVLRKKEDPTDLLSQVQYNYVKSVQAELQQTADAPKVTVFYEVDMPLIKEVISTYISAYNASILARAFNVKQETKEEKIPESAGASNEVLDILRLAKQAKTDGKNREKSRLVGEAIQMQPGAFVVDDPYGKHRDTPPSDSYPGVSYKPTGHRFQFHIDKEFIPANLSTSVLGKVASEVITKDDINEPADNLAPSVVGTGSAVAEAVKLRIKKPKEQPKEAELAKVIWTSIRDRSQVVFDMEGVEPHKFMDHLFNEMDTQLDRSNIIKSPYPESWLGTNTVERLRNDPNKLGEVIERQYYAEKMKEYVGALEGKYMKNYMVPTVLLNTIESAKIKYAKDPVALKTSFMERLKLDASRPQLVTTNYILRPYAMAIAIMRAIISIPEGERDAYVAGEIDETMRKDIRSQMYHNLITPILPDEHPQYEPKPPIPGCMDSTATNYDPIATVDDGSCQYPPVEEEDDDENNEPPEEDNEAIAGEEQPEAEEPGEEVIEEIPAPPEMEVDQLDANWEEINPVIPEPDDIEEFEEEGNPADNPKGVFDDKWMYYDREHRSGDGQLRVKMDDGEIVQYKFHIALDPSDYMERTRDIVSTFLNRNKIYYKCGGSKGNQAWRTLDQKQYGKMFTLFVGNHKEAITVTKGMVLLAAKHNLKGLVFQPKDWSNLTYERVVPGTNNTLYYTVEKASAGAVVKAGIKAKYVEKHKGRLWEMQGEGERRRNYRTILPFLEREKRPPKGAKVRPGWKPPKLSYLGYDLYRYRDKVMDYYWGQGPIDGLPIWGDKPPSKPPSEPPSTLWPVDIVIIVDDDMEAMKIKNVIEEAVEDMTTWFESIGGAGILIKMAIDELTDLDAYPLLKQFSAERKIDRNNLTNTGEETDSIDSELRRLLADNGKPLSEHALIVWPGTYNRTYFGATTGNSVDDKYRGNFGKKLGGTISIGSKNFFRYGDDAAYMLTCHELAHLYGATNPRRHFLGKETIDHTGHCTVVPTCIMTGVEEYYLDPGKLAIFFKKEGILGKKEMFCPTCQKYIKDRQRVMNTGGVEDE